MNAGIEEATKTKKIVTQAAPRDSRRDNTVGASLARKSNRLVEIDFFRGLALLVIFWNHLQWLLQEGFPLRYGFSDAAAVFVFLSGYVSGLVYWKAYIRQGFRGAMEKAWKRSGQLYLAHLASLFVLLGIGTFMPVRSLPDPLLAFLHTLEENPFGFIGSVMTLRYFPPLFDILPLYIVLLLAVPVVLLVIERDWRILIAGSLLLWGATQAFPALDIRWFSTSWTFNPLSWFFLFALAMTLGIKRLDQSLRIPVKGPYIALALCLIVYAFCDLTTVNELLQRIGIVTETTAVLFPSPFPLVEKLTMEPAYLVHFLSLAYVVSICSPHLQWLGNNELTKPVVLTGQNSLVLFSAGIALVYLFSSVMILYEFNSVVLFFFQLFGCAITLAAGVLLSSIKQPLKHSTVRPSVQPVRSTNLVPYEEGVLK